MKTVSVHSRHSHAKAAAKRNADFKVAFQLYKLNRNEVATKEPRLPYNDHRRPAAAAKPHFNMLKNIKEQYSLDMQILRKVLSRLSVVLHIR